MTNADILKIAMEQSAIDSSCDASDFLSKENRVVISRENPLARRYLELPFLCDLCCYGGGIVASVSPGLEDIVSAYISRFEPYRCFETPALNALSDALRPLGVGLCFMAEYFLPDLSAMPSLDIPYETRVMGQADFNNLYLPEWSNALCEKRRELDVLAVGAFDKGKLIALAGCSADCDTMWQIGIDVLPPYRRQGIASALTSRLAKEILARGKVPFYCCAWSNLASARNAVKSGFRPAWVQATAKSLDYI